jgi:NAD+ kinase
MSHFSRIGVIAKQDARAIDTARRLLAYLSQAGHVPLLDRHLAQRTNADTASIRERDALGTECDLVIVVGGDGTLLSAARSLAPSGVPILGINQGRLGFMVDVAPDDMETHLDQVLDGHYVAEQRLLLTAHIESQGRSRGTLLAVNDVVVRNLAAIRMLEFETWLDDQFISQHRADGMIVSTPTGSTAYALSGGGPVVHPGLEALSLVPICPHTLSDRPIVVGADRPVHLVLGGGTGTSAAVTCDGQTHEVLRVGDRLTIQRAHHRLHLIHPARYDYFSILRDKLHWGRAPA